MQIYDENTGKSHRKIIYRKGMNVKLNPLMVPPEPILMLERFTINDYRLHHSESKAQANHFKYMKKYNKQKKEYTSLMKKWKKLKPNMIGKIISTEKNLINVKFNSGLLYSLPKSNINKYLFVLHENISEGMFIQTEFGMGVVKYKGIIQSKEDLGTFVGIFLENPGGKNDGKVYGKRYFKTKKNHGIFIRLNLLQYNDGKNNKKNMDEDISDELLNDDVLDAVAVLDDALGNLDSKGKKELSFELSVLTKKLKKKSLKKPKYTSLIGNNPNF